MSPALHLKQYLSTKIPEILKSFLKDVEKFEKEHGDGKNALLELNKDIEVFDIQFAFNNHDLIELLK